MVGSAAIGAAWGVGHTVTVMYVDKNVGTDLFHKPIPKELRIGTDLYAP